MAEPDLNAAWAKALLQELARAGAKDAVVCPGSRSSPLAVGAAEPGGPRVWSVVDERSAAFFALGLSRASGRPVPVIATSGSAGAHFLPAAIEAHLGAVPLVLLTADRPWELHGFGAPQTIDQEGLFGRFVRASHALPAPEATDTAFLHLRALVARALGEGQGPLHLNVPFREPLAPTGGPPPPLSKLALDGREGAFLELHRQGALPDLAEVAARVGNVEEGVIVCGPRTPEPGFAEALSELSRATGYPLLAEAVSNARFGSGGDAVVAHYEALLAHPPFAGRVRPGMVLRFGAGLTSKRLQQWLDGSSAEVVVFSDSGLVADPSHRASTVVHAPALAAAQALAAAVGQGPARAGRWRQTFIEAERQARTTLEEAFSSTPETDALTEPRIARDVCAALPPDAPLFVSSSMPIRELDGFGASARAPLQVFANRGANGIDGIVSSASGVAAALGRPTALLTGDLALLHDLGGLLMARRHGLPLTVVVVNNDGGGIFSFLPIASATPHFETLFGTPHGVDLAHVAGLANAVHHTPSSPAGLRAAVAAGMEGGLHLIEVKVPRADNPRVHRALWEQVGQKLGEGPWA